MSHDETGTVLDLPGLDGSNPLGFLAALGSLRLMGEEDDGRPTVRLGWQQAFGTWIPRLKLAEMLAEEELSEVLADALNASDEHSALKRWDDLTVDPGAYREFVVDAIESSSPEDRSWVDFAASFGCEALPEPNASRPIIRDTAFRTMSGAGHQHFLKTMRHVLEEVTAEHVSETLFHPWEYEDPLEKSTLRWDPVDDVRYALRWRNPSGDPDRKKRGSMLGANALAVHALPFFPTAPVGRRLATTGFRRFGRLTAWSWPIWEPVVPASVVRSLLSMPELQNESTDRATLAPRGIVEVYRSRRITVGKYRNFTPAEPV